MYKLFYFFILLFLFFSSCSIIKKNIKNKDKIDRLTTICFNDSNSTKEQIYRYGKLVYERDNNNGILQTIIIIPNDTTKEIYYYYDNSIIKSYNKYINEKPDGTWLTWYKNGFIESCGNFNYKNIMSVEKIDSYTGVSFLYKEYKLNGKWLYWFSNGQLMKEEMWDNGLLINIKKYNDQGKLLND